MDVSQNELRNDDDDDDYEVAQVFSEILQKNRNFLQET
jgi:hypothetical protein